MKRITIQDLCDTVRGVSYKPGDVVRDQANGVPILRASNIQNGEIVFDDLIFVKSNAVRAEQYLQPGDVLICGSSGSPELVGKAAPFSSYNRPISFGAFCKVIRIKKILGINSDFIQLFFQSPRYRFEIKNIGTGIGIKNIKGSDLLNLSIDVPDISKQNEAVSKIKTIICAMKKIDSIRELANELIRTRFINFQRNSATQVSLCSICKPRQWKTLSGKELEEKGFPVWGANGIIGHYHSFNHDGETIMITCRGATCGTINRAFGKCYITGNAMCLDDIDPAINKDYLFCCLENFDFTTVISGTAQPQITREGLAGVYFQVPSKKEQDSFSLFYQTTKKFSDDLQKEKSFLNEILVEQFRKYFDLEV